MADEDDGQVQLALDGLEEGDELPLAGGVDAGGGLVEQQQPWAGGERAGDQDALELAAGQLGGRAGGEVGEADAVYK